MTKEDLIESGASRLRVKIVQFKAQTARNSQLLRRFVTQKWTILRRKMPCYDSISASLAKIPDQGL